MKAIRVLHVLSRFDVGGIEKWLLDFHREQCNFATMEYYFLCISGKKGFWDKSIESPICYEPNLKKGKLGFFLELFKFARKRKNDFDIIHLHLYKFSSFMAIIFWLCGFRNIVAHAHNDKRVLPKSKYFIKKMVASLYNFLAKLFFKISTKHCVAASQGAAEDVFGSLCVHKTKIIYCGIELLDVRSDFQRGVYRTELGDEIIPFVNVASLTKQKNQKFLIDVFERIVLQNDKVRLFIIGDGPLRDEINFLIDSKGLKGKVILLGNRSDILSVLQNFSKAFVFPSLYEGLGLALVEAQFCGNYCFISENIPSEAIVEPDLICRLPLDVGLWSTSIIKDLDRIGNALPVVRSENHFSINVSANNFHRLYLSMISQK